MLRYMLGLVAGSLMAMFFVDLLTAEDPVQKESSKRAQKAYCKSLEEMLLFPQDPQDRFEFINKHQAIINHCRELLQ